MDRVLIGWRRDFHSLFRAHKLHARVGPQQFYHLPGNFRFHRGFPCYRAGVLANVSRLGMGICITTLTNKPGLVFLALADYRLERSGTTAVVELFGIEAPHA
jgi:hypothetical protein